jgi:hypothetical protein
MGRSYNKKRRTKDPKEGSKEKIQYHKSVGRQRIGWADEVQRDALELLGI